MTVRMVHGKGEIPMYCGAYEDEVLTKEQAEEVAKRLGVREAYWLKDAHRLYYNPMEGLTGGGEGTLGVGRH